MSQKKSPAKDETEKQPPAHALDESEVAAYLVANPDFLLKHPETLEAVQIPHDAGNAVSLIEHQVRTLRETNARIRGRFDELFTTAQRNQERVVQLNRVARIMASAHSIDEMLAELTDCLHENLAVDRVFVGVKCPLPAHITHIRALDETGTADKILTDAFRRGKPICGELDISRSEALFGADDALPMLSAATIPFRIGGEDGAIVLASADPKHFTEDMGTLFVELFGDLLEVALSRLLDTQNAS